MRTRRSLYPLVLLTFFPQTLLAQQARVIELDLALPVSKQNVEPNERIRFRLVNRLPHASYEILAERESANIPPLDLAAGWDSVGHVRGLRDDPCSPQFENARTQIDSVSDETDLPETITDLSQPTDACPSPSVRLFLEELTSHDPGIQELLTRGEKLNITVRRSADPDRDLSEREWQFVFSAGEIGSWRTTFGFMFVSNRWEQEVYLDQVPGEEKDHFVLRKKDRDKGYVFVPAVIFQWSPQPSGNCLHPALSCGFSGGAGLDTGNPSVFGGVHLTYQENLSFQVGFGTRQAQRRNMRYAVGDTLLQVVGNDELYTKVFKPNWFFGISLRFEKNPFVGSEEGSETGAGSGGS